MKNLLIVLVMLSVFSAEKICAQGTVNFSSTSAAHQIFFRCVPCEVGQATVGLYGGPLGASESSLVLIGATVLNGVNGGINGGIRTSPFVFGGQVGTFQIRAWTGGLATYEEVIASGGTRGIAGVSQVFNNITSNPNGLPPTPPANLIGWTNRVWIMSLSGIEGGCVPEPSTIVLSVLGAASLLLLRRK